MKDQTASVDKTLLELEPYRGLDYDLEDITRALFAVALTGGSYKRAAEKLTEMGYKATKETIRDWVYKYPNRYARARAQAQEYIEPRQIGEISDLISIHNELELLAANKLIAALEEDQVNPRDLANVLRNAATSKAINVDKYMLLLGRPTNVVKHTGDEFAEKLEQLKQFGIDLKFNAPVIEAEVIEETETASET